MSSLKIILYCLIPFLLVNGSILASENIQANLKSLLERKHFSKAEFLLKQSIKTDANNSQHHFQLARVLAWQKKFSESLIEYDWLINRYPTNNDYLFGKAQTLYWSGQNTAALKLLESSKFSANASEMWRLEISILQRSNKISDQKKAKSLLAEARTRFPNKQWPTDKSLEKNTLAKKYTEVEIGLGADILDNGYDNWASQYLMAEHQYENSSKVYTAVTLSQRYQLQDEELMLGYFTPLSLNWNIIAETSLSPSYKIRPNWSVFLQLQRKFKHGWNGYLGLRTSKYRETDTQTLNFSLERYWKNFRFGYTAYLTQVNGAAISAETLLAHVVAADYYYGDRSHFGLAVSTGKELEYNGTANPPISNISALVLKGRHWYKPKWAFSYALNFHQQGNFYSRYGYQLGLRYRY